MALANFFSPGELGMLRTAMEWVIPTDSRSPGAGGPEAVAHLLSLLEQLGEPTLARYRLFLPTLTEADLHNPNHEFAPTFIDHVRDVYYGYADTGAWEDIGFTAKGSP